jgi:capsular exopolysaccharide synthesis family protein
MSNILVGNCTLAEAVCPTSVPNVDVLPSGPIPPNPSELLGSNHMRELLEEARKHYDRIVIDSPPITAVTDAVLLSKLVDGVVVVIRSGVTHRQVVKNGLAQLQGVGAHILGAVLNGVSMGRDSYYYYQYYYYYYGADGEKRKGVRKKRSSKRRSASSAGYGEDGIIHKDKTI